MFPLGEDEGYGILGLRGNSWWRSLESDEELQPREGRTPPVDVANLIHLYEGTDTDDWAAFLEGKDDASRYGVLDEMADATEGLADLRSKLAAADEQWAAGRGASRLAPVSVSGSNEHGGAVLKHASVPKLDPGTGANGGVKQTDVAGRACDLPKRASRFIRASRKMNGRWYRWRDDDGKTVEFTWDEVRAPDGRAHNICRGLVWDKSEFKRVLAESRSSRTSEVATGPTPGRTQCDSALLKQWLPPTSNALTGSARTMDAVGLPTRYLDAEIFWVGLVLEVDCWGWIWFDVFFLD